MIFIKGSQFIETKFTINIYFSITECISLGIKVGGGVYPQNPSMTHLIAIPSSLLLIIHEM